MLKLADTPAARLRYLADAIEHGFDGLGFDMDSWGRATPCGTTGCIAGHAVAIWAPVTWQRFLDLRAKFAQGCSDSAYSEYYQAADDLAHTACSLLGGRAVIGGLFFQSTLTRSTAAAELRRLADLAQEADE